MSVIVIVMWLVPMVYCQALIKINRSLNLLLSVYKGLKHSFIAFLYMFIVFEGLEGWRLSQYALTRGQRVT